MAEVYQTHTFSPGDRVKFRGNISPGLVGTVEWTYGYGLNVNPNVSRYSVVDWDSGHYNCTPCSQLEPA